MLESCRIFVSYSHSDSAFLEQFLKHICPLVRLLDLDVFSDRDLTTSSELDLSLMTKLRNSDVFVCLISSDFLASSYCRDVELGEALSQHRLGTMDVFPVILRSCQWKETPLANLLCAPLDAKPVIEWEYQDRAWTDVAERLKQVVKSRTKTTNDLGRVALEPSLSSGNKAIQRAMDSSLGMQNDRIGSWVQRTSRMTKEIEDAVRRLLVTNPHARPHTFAERLRNVASSLSEFGEVLAKELEIAKSTLSENRVASTWNVSSLDQLRYATQKLKEIEHVLANLAQIDDELTRLSDFDSYIGIETNHASTNLRLFSELAQQEHASISESLCGLLGNASVA